MNVDPQRINAFGNLVVRNKRTGDRDVTEFQSCWRNLNATIDGFPHWLHPSKGVVGRTNIIGHVRSARGGCARDPGRQRRRESEPFRTRDREGRVARTIGFGRTGEVELSAVHGQGRLGSTSYSRNCEAFLGAGGYGTILVTCAEADVNCQILTCSTAGSVSLQHMWGY